MKESRILLIFCLITLAVAIISWLVLTPEFVEPSYQGKNLGDWMQDFDPQHRLGISSEEIQKARVAIRQMGTNTIPFLIPMLARDDSRWKLKLIHLLQRQHHFPVNYIPAGNYNSSAMLAFMELGTNGQSAVPQLVKIATGRYSDLSQVCALHCLENIGPPARSAVPALIKQLGHSTSYTRVMVVNALGAIQSQPALTIPALIPLLDDSDWNIRRSAALQLGRFNNTATAAVPALRKALADPNPGVRSAASDALRLIDPTAAPAGR